MHRRLIFHELSLIHFPPSYTNLVPFFKTTQFHRFFVKWKFACLLEEIHIHSPPLKSDEKYSPMTTELPIKGIRPDIWEQ